jgi:4-hydroxythreonine-4-phosphate dehydrogenase
MLLGITLGDASGVGPEILLKAVRDGQLPYPFICYGDLAALEFYNRKLAYNVPLRKIADAREYEAGSLCVVDAGALTEDSIRVGVVDRQSGAAAREYVVAATGAALTREISAIVTLPINKEATQLTDPGFTGHTELIGQLCGREDVTIMLASDQLLVSHVSTHVSLRRAIEAVKQDRVFKILELTSKAVARLRSNPRIAVAGLNPHAGENGLFGDEEEKEIRPAVERARSLGMPVEGPVAPDTVFYLAVRKHKYDAVVCMYHDQGHIPLKLLDFDGGVNVTLGLPIIRTSVDHGTAFDIAGKGVASTTSLLKAADLAAKLAEDGGW